MGCALAWSGPIFNKLGMSVWFFDKLYGYAWFVGFGVAGLVYSAADEARAAGRLPGT